jgi:malate dehydrogenase (oxaloacetate-decarboxylating)(NADP+)
MRRRRGAMKTTATARMRQPDYFGAMMLSSGDADMMISGYAAHYADSLRMILRVIGTAPGVRRISTNSNLAAVCPSQSLRGPHHEEHREAPQVGA